jgi:hypothetical protein
VRPAEGEPERCHKCSQRTLNAVRTMARGLGSLQREIKHILDRAALLPSRTLSLAGIRAVLVLQRGDSEHNTLAANSERTLQRALKGLVDRGEVVIAQGRGGPGDPYRYTTVECFASTTGRDVRDTAHAKQIVAEMTAAASAVQAKLPGALDRLKAKSEE